MRHSEEGWQSRAPTPLLLAHNACYEVAALLSRIWLDASSPYYTKIARAAARAVGAKPRTIHTKQRQTIAIQEWRKRANETLEMFFELRALIGKAEPLLAEVAECFGAVANRPFYGIKDIEVYHASAHEWVLATAGCDCSGFSDTLAEWCWPEGVHDPDDLWKCSKEDVQACLAPEIFVDWDFGIPLDDCSKVDSALEQELFRAWKQFYPDWKPTLHFLRNRP